MPVDYAEAFTHYSVGAAQSFPDYVDEARRQYLIAAENGIATGHYRLEVMYEEGIGIPADPVEGLKWYTLAVGCYPWNEQGQRAEGEARLSALLSRLTTEQASEAETEAREWRTANLESKGLCPN